MKDQNPIIVKQLTYEECLRESQVVLIKHIMVRMTELNAIPYYCSKSMQHEIFSRIEKKLMGYYKYQLIEILESENLMMKICYKVKKSMLREVVNSLNSAEITKFNNDNVIFSFS